MVELIHNFYVVINGSFFSLRVYLVRVVVRLNVISTAESLPEFWKIDFWYMSWYISTGLLQSHYRKSMKNDFCIFHFG